MYPTSGVQFNAMPDIRRHMVLIMTYVNNSGGTYFTDLEDQLGQETLLWFIQSLRGFVQHEQGRIFDQRPGQQTKSLHI